MAFSIEFEGAAEQKARIKVVGVGGSGGNALNTMIASGLDGVEFIAANTDAQALDANLAPTKIQLGPTLTKGLGAGGNPDVGRKAALEDMQKLAEALSGADMVFITAGMGGGTGTGAAPIIAHVAKEQGALTVGVVTKPFLFEGKRRGKNADQGVRELIDTVDSIITIPNQKLLALGDPDITMLDAFQRADDVLLQAVQGISDLINHHGMINVDFADVKTIMSKHGRALMGTGFGKGERRALDAAEMAINSPLLDDVSVDGATGILINFTAGPDVRLSEINAAATLIQEAAHEDAEIIFGMVTDPDLSDIVKVTVIATGFDEDAQMVEESHARQRASLPFSTMGHSPVRQAAVRAPTAPRSTVVPSMPSSGSAARPVNAAPPSLPPSRGSMPMRPSAPPAMAHAAAAAHASAAHRPFGADALADEAVLDIPAFLRRNSAVPAE
ncbi:MAG: cell division protein FtsZ [Polyangiales bacterium]